MRTRVCYDPRKVSHASGRSINLIITKRGLDALNIAGLKEDILQITSPVKGRMIHTVNGTICQPYDPNNDNKNLSVMRQTLNVLLINFAEKIGVKFEFEEELLKVNPQDRRCTFSNKTIQGGQVFGCDGVNSICRQALGVTNTAQVFSKKYVELTVINDSNFDKEYLHIWPRQTEMVMALPNLNEGFTVTWFGGDCNNALPDMSKKFPNANKHFCVKNKKKTSRLQPVNIAKWNHEDWLLLLGDACHGIVPFYGQGMNCGFEDVTVLMQMITLELHLRIFVR